MFPQPFILDSQGKYYARLDYTRDFAHPIHRILYSDVTGDGLCELVVLSTAGLHVLQVGQPLFLYTLALFSILYFLEIKLTTITPSMTCWYGHCLYANIIISSSNNHLIVYCG